MEVIVLFDLDGCLLRWTLMMTSAKVVQHNSLPLISVSPFQDYSQPEN